MFLNQKIAMLFADLIGQRPPMLVFFKPSDLWYAPDTICKFF